MDIKEFLSDEHKSELELLMEQSNLLMKDWVFEDNIMKLKINFINKSNNPDPTYSKDGDSGFDLRANLPNNIDKPLLLDSGKILIISTGLHFQIPKNFELQVRSRSGLAAKHGVMVLNSPGTVDCVPGNTMISTPNGDYTAKHIFDNNIKDILSFNEETFSLENDEINDIWIVKDKECLMIETETNTITVPIEKEIYTKRGWVKAYNLTSEDEILTIT